MCVFMIYIYIYIYMERERHTHRDREKETERGRERGGKEPYCGVRGNVCKIDRESRSERNVTEIEINCNRKAKKEKRVKDRFLCVMAYQAILVVEEHQ